MSGYSQDGYRFVPVAESPSPGLSPANEFSERLLSVPVDSEWRPLAGEPRPSLSRSSDIMVESAGTSVRSASFMLSNTIIGAGMMALPYSFKVLGIIGGCLGLVGACSITYLSIHLLVRASTIMGENTYNSLTETVFGSRAERLIKWCIIINNLGLLVAFLDIIGDCLAGGKHEHSGVATYWNNHFGDKVPHFWLSRPVLVGLVIVTMILPFQLRANINDAKYTSAFALTFAACFILTITGLGIVVGSHHETHDIRMFPAADTDIKDLIACIPILFTAYICQYNIHPLMKNLVEPQNENVLKVSRYALGTTSLIYVAAASAAYVMFGDNVEGDILENLADKLTDRVCQVNSHYSHANCVNGMNILISVIKAGYSAALALTFPVISLALRENVMDVMPAMSIPLSLQTKAVGVGLLVLEYLLCIAVPSINTVFQLSGSSVSIIIGFIMPALISMRLDCTRSFIDLIISSGLFWVTLLLGLTCFSVACVNAGSS